MNLELKPATEIKGIVARFTREEREIFFLLLMFNTLADISRVTGLSIKTIKYHCGKIYQAFGIGGGTGRSNKRLTLYKHCYRFKYDPCAEPYPNGKYQSVYPITKHRRAIINAEANQ